MPFEVFGYFEELYDAADLRFIGIRNCAEQPGRECGSTGHQYENFKKGQRITLQMGHKGAQPYIFKADTRCRTTYLPLCGRLKKELHSA